MLSRKAKEDFRTPNAPRPHSTLIYNLFVNLMLLGCKRVVVIYQCTIRYWLTEEKELFL